MSDQPQRQVLPPDPMLRMLMKIGLPIGAVSLICLWLAYFLNNQALLTVFFVTALVAFGIGLVYNARLVLVMLRRKREEQNSR
ncbi:hypothetical protein M0534_12180 [Methylonatrum kenyense]|uniref:hypothetical protein n=1 Tax=Methylonatrum kenyense TaxID=455253 RepID=UPI0020BE8C3C|nr:hypothetical protein [Methylonatrum kenyense]MCK8517078.1 hypothetical protein [Methylonatrum kenyense]